MRRAPAHGPATLSKRRPNSDMANGADSQVAHYSGTFSSARSGSPQSASILSRTASRSRTAAPKSGPQSDKATRSRLYACGPWAMVDRGVFTEHFTRTQLAKTHYSTGVRVDSDVGFPCGDVDGAVKKLPR